MNTKFFFLLLVSLLITNTTSSIVINKKEPVAVETTHQSRHTETPKDDLPNQDFPAPHDLPRDLRHAEKIHVPNSDDDGKHHHFHFNRIANPKRRWFLLFLSKVVLAIMHICSFLYCYLHVFH